MKNITKLIFGLALFLGVVSCEQEIITIDPSSLTSNAINEPSKPVLTQPETTELQAVQTQTNGERSLVSKHVNTWQFFDGGKSVASTVLNYDKSGKLLSTRTDKFRIDAAGVSTYKSYNIFMMKYNEQGTLYEIETENQESKKTNTKGFYKLNYEGGKLKSYDQIITKDDVAIVSIKENFRLVYNADNTLKTYFQMNDKGDVFNFENGKHVSSQTSYARNFKFEYGKATSIVSDADQTFKFIISGLAIGDPYIFGFGLASNLHPTKMTSEQGFFYNYDLKVNEKNQPTNIFIQGFKEDGEKLPSNQIIEVEYQKF